jgi:alcohol dehydrogenase (cytochrome c)
MARSRVYRDPVGWGVDAQRIPDALTTNNIGLENNVPQGGVVWVFAVKK